jgi:hypothetical protein
MPSTISASSAASMATDDNRWSLEKVERKRPLRRGSGDDERALRLPDGADVLRARSAVQRRIRNALERIREHSPWLAAFLERSIKTGTVCIFSPVASARRF